MLRYLLFDISVISQQQEIETQERLKAINDNLYVSNHFVSWILSESQRYQDSGMNPFSRNDSPEERL